MALKRMIVIAGHYGSGKTELAVSLALDLAKETKRAWPRLHVDDCRRRHRSGH